MSVQRANLSLLMDQFKLMGYQHVHTWDDGYGRNYQYTFERLRKPDSVAPDYPQSLVIVVQDGVATDVMDGRRFDAQSHLLGTLLDKHLLPAWKRVKEQQVDSELFVDLVTAELRKSPQLKHLSTSVLGQLVECWRPDEKKEISTCATAEWRIWTFKYPWKEASWKFRTVSVAGHGTVLKPENEEARKEFWWPKAF